MEILLFRKLPRGPGLIQRWPDRIKEQIMIISWPPMPLHDLAGSSKYSLWLIWDSSSSIWGVTTRARRERFIYQKEERDRSWCVSGAEFPFPAARNSPTRKCGRIHIKQGWSVYSLVVRHSSLCSSTIMYVYESLEDLFWSWEAGIAFIC